MGRGTRSGSDRSTVAVATGARSVGVARGVSVAVGEAGAARVGLAGRGEAAMVGWPTAMGAGCSFAAEQPPRTMPSSVRLRATTTARRQPPEQIATYPAREGLSSCRISFSSSAPT